MKIALIGYGVMGKLVQAIAEEKGHVIAAVIDDADETSVAITDKIRRSDVAIDFTSSAAVRRNVEVCVAEGVPLVEGTTGWNAQLDDIRRVVLDGDAAMVYGANFSIGVNLFYRIVEVASELFAGFPEYEVFIEEQHHSRKKDAPSGTALKLKEIVAESITSRLDIASIRAGNIPGTHRVGFDGPADQLLLEHTARSREGFAAGAIMAAEWIIGKKGFYEFGEVIEEKIRK